MGNVFDDFVGLNFRETSYFGFNGNLLGFWQNDSVIHAPKDTTQFALQMHSGHGIVILNISTPPAVVGSPLSGNQNMTFYVPDDALSAYKTHSYFRARASRFFPLSDCPYEYD